MEDQNMKMSNLTKKEKFGLGLLIIILSISLGGNLQFYYYWTDIEYPSGYVYHNYDTIDIYIAGYYCDHKVICFGSKHVYEIQDFDVEKKLFRELETFGINYSVSLENSTSCYGEPGMRVQINDYRTVDFEIRYHTYDRMMPGNQVFYSKTKVIERLRISSLSWCEQYESVS